MVRGAGRPSTEGMAMRRLTGLDSYAHDRDDSSRSATDEVRMSLPKFAAATMLAITLGATASAQSVTLKLATDSGAKGSPSGDAMDRWASLVE